MVSGPAIRTGKTQEYQIYSLFVSITSCISFTFISILLLIRVSLLGSFAQFVSITAAFTRRTNQRGKATAGSCSSVEEDGGGRDEEDSKPSPVTSSALPIGSYPHQEVVVQEEATTPDEIPSGWTRVKLEPDC